MGHSSWGHHHVVWVYELATAVDFTANHRFALLHGVWIRLRFVNAVKWRFEFVLAIAHQCFIHRNIGHFNSLLQVLNLNLSLSLLQALLGLGSSFGRFFAAPSDRLDNLLREDKSDLRLAGHMELQVSIIAGWNHSLLCLPRYVDLLQSHLLLILDKLRLHTLQLGVFLLQLLPQTYQIAHQLSLLVIRRLQVRQQLKMRLFVLVLINDFLKVLNLTAMFRSDTGELLQVALLQAEVILLQVLDFLFLRFDLFQVLLRAVV